MKPTNICLIVVALVVSSTALANTDPSRRPRPPALSQYLPYALYNTKLERYRVLGKPRAEVWRDGRRQALQRGDVSRLQLPEECWAIKYTYVWNDESPSPNHKPGTLDEEPVVVFVSDAGRVVGVQTKFHDRWLPINTGFIPQDFVQQTHVIVGFFANVHTPVAGLLPAIAALAVGNVPADIAAAIRYLEDQMKAGIVALAK